MNLIGQHSVEHASYMEREATHPTSTIKQIQVVKAMINTPSSLATTACVSKSDTKPETVLKDKKTPESVLSTGNHV